MFSSNQLLEVSGCIEHENELKNALEFALKASDDIERFTRNESPARCVYQITPDGKYCIGHVFGEIKDGWLEFPFDFDLDIISMIIQKHLNAQKIEYGGYDGSYRKGFVMRAIETSFADIENGIKNPFYGIVYFQPFTCFYAK